MCSNWLHRRNTSTNLLYLNNNLKTKIPDIHLTVNEMCRKIQALTPSPPDCAFKIIVNSKPKTTSCLRNMETKWCQQVFLCSEGVISKHCHKTDRKKRRRKDGHFMDCLHFTYTTLCMRPLMPLTAQRPHTCKPI